MVAYAFEKRHHDNILSGAKPFTLRATGKKRHARIGEEIQGRDGRTGPKFFLADCVCRARVLIAARGIVRVLSPSFTPAGEPHWRMLQACEQGAPQAAEHLEKFALQDGFTTWADLVRWHAEQEAPDDNGLLSREFIGWAQPVPVATRRAEA